MALEPTARTSCSPPSGCDDNTGAIVMRDVTPPKSPPRLNSATDAIRLARRQPKLRDWIGLYPTASAPRPALGDDRDLDGPLLRPRRRRGRRGAQSTTRGCASPTCAPGRRSDWMQARGLPDVVRAAGQPLVAVRAARACCSSAGLMDWRRPLSLRTLDLLVLVSFGDLAALVQPRRPVLVHAAGLPAAALPGCADDPDRRSARRPRRSPIGADAHADPGGARSSRWSASGWG